MIIGIPNGFEMTSQIAWFFCEVNLVQCALIQNGFKNDDWRSLDCKYPRDETSDANGVVRGSYEVDIEYRSSSPSS